MPTLIFLPCRINPAHAQRRRAIELVCAADDKLLGSMIAALEAVVSAAEVAGRCPRAASP